MYKSQVYIIKLEKGEWKLKRKAVSGTMLTLLLTSMLILVLNVKPVKTSGEIYIRPDGSIDPPTAPIQRIGDIYRFTDDIYNNSIVVQRDNITLDGNGHQLQGFTGFPIYNYYGVYLQERME